ncbi:MAG TPA: DUF2474 domain-containing protein [Allosphingosinicella sp.]|jgi:phage shock protein PspC (stress-responsive transcriptional regulator)
MSIEPAPLKVRLAWFVALWVAGVATVGSVAYLIRWWIHP